MTTLQECTFPCLPPAPQYMQCIGGEHHGRFVENVGTIYATLSPVVVPVFDKGAGDTPVKHGAPLFLFSALF